MSQAVDAYVNMATAVDGSSPGSIKIPRGISRIIALIVAVVIDGAVGLDIAATFTIKLRGKALPGGDQEIGVGGINSQEEGASVGITLSSEPADYIPVDIPVTEGEDLFVDAAHHGTDLGTPFIGATLVLG